MKSKIEEHAGIQIPIYYHEDKDGKKVYDYELMTKEFETKLSELGYSSRDEVKHFADGFHEGRWEDDVEYSEFAHLSTDRVNVVKYDGDGKPLKSVKDSDNCYSEFDD